MSLWVANHITDWIISPVILSEGPLFCFCFFLFFGGILNCFFFLSYFLAFWLSLDSLGVWHPTKAPLLKSNQRHCGQMVEMLSTTLKWRKNHHCSQVAGRSIGLKVLLATLFASFFFFCCINWHLFCFCFCFYKFSVAVNVWTCNVICTSTLSTYETFGLFCLF